jgi:geranylgeranyl pyrophosphate synthase
MLGPEKDLPEEVLQVAAGIELIHMATLLHDDIIDNSSLRRHQLSAFKKFGLADSLLAGDFLLVRAFSLCAHLDEEIIKSTERACIELTEGEILEVPLFAKSHTRQSALEIAEKKTASLFWLSTRSAAHLMAPGEHELIEDLSTLGRSLGVAFQILDDLLDVLSHEDLLGKKSGGDILERKPSFVNVLWLETGSTLSQGLLSPPGEDEERFLAQALEEIRHSAVPALARQEAEKYAHEALRLLEKSAKKLPEQSASLPWQKALESIIRYTLERLA